MPSNTTDTRQRADTNTKPPPRAVLVLDVGGSHVKARLSGSPAEIAVVSGKTLTPRDMMTALRTALAGWHYDVVSIGFPALVAHGHIAHEPVNLGPGWVGFDFTAAFGCPVKVINDAAMQALGSYDGGCMLFLGLGTGLGSAMIVDGRVEPMELAHVPYKQQTYEDYVGESARERLGEAQWRAEVMAVIETLRTALEPDYVVLGGGNVRLLASLPEGVRRGNNANAFEGGFRLWNLDNGAPS